MLLPSLCRSTGSGVTVAVLLTWEPPKEGDLPVHNYRVTWTSRHAHAASKHTQTMRPTHSRASEQGKKQSSTRVTQGVRKQFYNFNYSQRNTASNWQLVWVEPRHWPGDSWERSQPPAPPCNLKCLEKIDG